MQESLKTAPVLSSTKKKYFLYNLLHSALGGYKFSNEDDNVIITKSAHILQLLTYIVFGGTPFIIGMIITDKIIAGIISAAIFTFLNLLIKLLVHHFEKK